MNAHKIATSDHARRIVATQRPGSRRARLSFLGCRLSPVAANPPWMPAALIVGLWLVGALLIGEVAP